MRGITWLAAAVLLALGAAGTARADTLTLYSRLDFAPAVAKAFTAKTGIQVRVHRPPPAGLRARIIAEGHHPDWSLAWFYGRAMATDLDKRGLLARHLTAPAGLDADGRRLMGADGSAIPTGIVLGGVLLVAKAAPFASPAAWADLTRPAYHGIVGVSDPVTSEQAYGQVAGLLASAGGWDSGKEYLRTLKADGLHIYADTATTIAALRSGAIQLAIIRSSAAYQVANQIGAALRVIVARPVPVMTSVIVMAKGLTGRRRADARAFIAYVNSPAAQAIRMRDGGADADYWPVTAAPPPPGLPPLASLGAQDSTPVNVSPLTLAGWFERVIVGHSL